MHERLADTLGLESSVEERRAFGASLEHWPAFPDTADALRRLADRYRLVILSNVSNKGFAASNRKLGVSFDAAKPVRCRSLPSSRVSRRLRRPP